MTTSDEQAVANLLYRYAELVDDGDFEALGDLLDACLLISGDGDAGITGAAAITERYRSTTRRYDDGTPRTTHVVSNPIVEVDGDDATSASRYVVFQATDDLDLQPIITGRYHDRFRRRDGTWRFRERRMAVDLVGDLSAHLPPALVAHLGGPAAPG